MSKLAHDGRCLDGSHEAAPLQSVQEAYDCVLGLVSAPLPVEQVGFEDSPGRVLAEPVVARQDAPRFNQCAMDGYALALRACDPAAPIPVMGSSVAGTPPATLAGASAWRVLTGAPLPNGADTVVAQEDVILADGAITLRRMSATGANVRSRGEDVSAGASLIATGTRLDWRHVALLASQGIRTVAVRRLPRVAIISTGLELKPSDTALLPGQIHDSNGPMLRTLLRAAGAQTVACPIATDNPHIIRDALARVSAQVDLLLTSGGISAGEEDHVRAAVTAAGGSLTVFKLAMKPGKPLVAGRLGAAIFVGLPGNPQAALAGGMAFVLPLLDALLGVSAAPTTYARLRFVVPHARGQTEFIPVRLVQQHASLEAERTGPPGSGRLSPLLAADGLAMIPADAPGLVTDTLVRVLLFPRR